MKTNPVIIEFCGIPGCGKTTLCNHLSNRDEWSFGTMLDVLYAYRRSSIISKLKYFPYSAILRLLFALPFFPILPLKHWFLYFNFIKMLVLYGYCRCMKSFDFIVSDHGIIQSFVGLLFDHENELTQKRYRYIISVVKKSQPLLILLCEIPVDVSLIRIRGRNRNYGRLDVIGNDNILDEKLTNQDYLFKHVYMKCDGDHISCDKLEMDKSLDIIRDNLFGLISKHL